ncbi:MAG: hypothetical protein ABIN94_05855 [Ferruginibacter sp.]
MHRLRKAPESLIQIFNKLCLSQVKEQLTENLVYTLANPQSFTLYGHLYTYIPYSSVILDESLVLYGVDINLQATSN